MGKAAYKHKFLSAQQENTQLRIEMKNTISNMNDQLDNKDVVIKDKQDVIERLRIERNEFKEKYDEEQKRQEIVGENIRKDLHQKIDEIKKKVEEMNVQLIKKDAIIEFLERKTDEEHTRKVIEIVATEQKLKTDQTV